MHCAAGLDSVTRGSVMLGDTELTTLKEKDLTKVRRDHIGFVFQSFNLIPTLNAEENILLPLSIASAGSRTVRGSTRSSRLSASGTGSGTVRVSSPVVSSNGWRVRVPS